MLRFLVGLMAGKAFNTKIIPTKKLIAIFLYQKVLGFNRHVPWPVHWQSKVINPKNITRGNRFPGLGMGCHIDGRNGIIFGDNVWVGPKVSFISMNHDLNDYYHYTEADPIQIGDNCWFGVNSVVLPGVILGSHTVVAAGSVVTKSFPQGDQLLAGVPATVIKKLPEYRS